ncbi:MAG: peptide chain release factor N(5)-glutamine methyltransferase [Christensenellales bacterium]
MKNKNCCNIGGQAVLEGVMMRGESSMATAVRDSDGKIVIESSRFTPTKEKSKIYRVPVIRGMINFATSFVSGMKITMRSTEVYGDASTEEPSRFEKWLAKTFKVDIMNVVIAVGVILGVLLSLGLFVFVPQLVATGIFKLARLSVAGFGMSVLYNFIAGFIRMLIFILYLVLVSLMKDVKRLFMYHGAEHKTISCYEHGLPLTVENAQKMTTVHDRCGTTFMFIVMVFSILFFAIFPVELLAGGGEVVNFILRILSRIIMIPIVAGISYELLKLFAKYDNAFTRICKKPGLWLQKLTTKQPDDSMVEVAIAAFNEVLKLEEDKEYPTRSFVTYATVEKTVKGFSEALGNKAEAELILMNVLGAKTKTELYDGRRVSSEQEKQCAVYVKRRLKGAPLQYVLGETCFYGLDFKTDSRALIPRFDTEVVAEAAIESAKKYASPEILDLCTGSGAIAIAIKKNLPESKVTATDVSVAATELCKENAEKNDCEIEILEGSMFMPVRGRTFDVIVSNPPYICTGDIASLDKEVREYEPLSALDGGQDGLDFYRDIANAVKKYLKDNGTLVLETGIGQAEKVAELLGEGYEISFVKDMNNPPVNRAVVAVRLDKGEN